MSYVDPTCRLARRLGELHTCRRRDGTPIDQYADCDVEARAQFYETRPAGTIRPEVIQQVADRLLADTRLALTTRRRSDTNETTHTDGSVA